MQHHVFIIFQHCNSLFETLLTSLFPSVAATPLSALVSLILSLRLLCYNLFIPLQLYCQFIPEKNNPVIFFQNDMPLPFLFGGPFRPAPTPSWRYNPVDFFSSRSVAAESEGGFFGFTPGRSFQKSWSVLGYDDDS